MNYSQSGGFRFKKVKLPAEQVIPEDKVVYRYVTPSRAHPLTIRI